MVVFKTRGSTTFYLGFFSISFLSFLAFFRVGSFLFSPAEEKEKIETDETRWLCHGPVDVSSVFFARRRIRNHHGGRLSLWSPLLLRLLSTSPSEHRSRACTDEDDSLGPHGDSSVFPVRRMIGNHHGGRLSLSSPLLLCLLSTSPSEDRSRACTDEDDSLGLSWFYLHLRSYSLKN